MTQPPRAFVIGSIRIKDAAKWQQYRDAVPATLAPWRGEILLRGRRALLLSGETAHTDTVVIRFPDTASVEGWYRSDAYAALIALRNEAAEVLLVSYEG
ncbi:MAG: DUF1330 domain-containing protein [Methylibium sp.]|uniref:DUF1330 domain-containing protein n=1 Tax=Methylibium sp. TaxID=2067992 RepID=UPI0017A614E6|nr:DUF1330 domain-containing protein [Methylibium sp.]MBA2722698.1 DUF1330 domain-containing protein [Methylibium sp.]MBA3590059.1 DUF1330 domain-containing protein [Methylibium sp.]MBA3623116.1 DUF1330 domain-containing protein [Methylibium sp.]